MVPRNAALDIAKMIRIVTEFRKLHNYQLSNIWACDETGLKPFETDKKTIEMRGANSVSLKFDEIIDVICNLIVQVRIILPGNDKTSYSVMLCANAAGKKLPAVVVLARTRPLKKIEEDNKETLQILYTKCGGTTWFNTEKCLEFLRINFPVSFCFNLFRVLLRTFFVSTDFSRRCLARTDC
jgi:hypothetical protein